MEPLEHCPEPVIHHASPVSEPDRSSMEPLEHCPEPVIHQASPASEPGRSSMEPLDHCPEPVIHQASPASEPDRSSMEPLEHCPEPVIHQASSASEPDRSSMEPLEHCPEPVIIVVCPGPTKSVVCWEPINRGACAKIMNHLLTLCPKPIINIFIFCRKTCMRIIKWCQEMFSKYKPILITMAKFTGLFLCIADVGTDTNSTYQYYVNDNILWGTLTLVFTMNPILMTSIWHISNVLQEVENHFCLMCFFITPLVRKLDCENNSVLQKGLLVVIAVCVAPFTPFIYLLWGAVDSIRGEQLNGIAAGAAGQMKFCEAITESLPQAAVQMHIIAKNWVNGADIEDWQWATLTSSLIFLAFSLSTLTSAAFDDATISSRITFFVFGLLTTTARLMVSCVYFMTNSPWWFVPLTTDLLASIVVWCIQRWCRCSMCLPLNWLHHCSELGDVVPVFQYWVLTASFNCFTLSGLVVSTINIGFAIGGFFLDVPQTMAIITITLAIVSFVINIIITTVSRCRNIGIHWLTLYEEEDGTFSTLLY